VKDQNAVIVDGQMAGFWRVSDSAVEITPWRKLRGSEYDALSAAAERYGRFADIPRDAKLRVKWM